ncbi:MAG: hypothetical protein R3E13_12020 [Alphaproteobacteria bacterium]
MWDFSNPLSEKDQANARNIAKFHYGLDVEPLGCITHLQDPTMGITPHILVQDKHGEKHILHTRYAELSEEAYQIGQKGFAAYKKEALSVQKLQRNTDDNFITSIMSPTGGKHYAYLTNYVETEPSDPLNGNISYAELGKTVGIMRRVGLEIAEKDPAFTRQIKSYTDETATLLYKHGFSAISEQPQDHEETLKTLREWPEFMALIKGEDVPRFINHFNGQPRGIMARPDGKAHITSLATLSRGSAVNPADGISYDFAQVGGRIIVPGQTLDPKNLPESLTEYMNAYAKETGAEITPENTALALQRVQAQNALIGHGVKRLIELTPGLQ